MPILLWANSLDNVGGHNNLAAQVWRRTDDCRFRRRTAA
jgi:hypothetical protein